MNISRIAAASALILGSSSAFAEANSGANMALTTVVVGALVLVPYQTLCQFISVKVFESRLWEAGDPPLAKKIHWLARAFVTAVVIIAFMRDGRQLGPANWVESLGGTALASLIFMTGGALFFPSSQARRWAHNFAASIVGLAILVTSYSWLSPKAKEVQENAAKAMGQKDLGYSVISTPSVSGPWEVYQQAPGGTPVEPETAQETLQRYADGVIKQYPFLDRPEYTKVVSLIVAERDRLMAQGVPAPQALQRAADAIAPQFDPMRKN